jgi:thermitase
LEVQETIMSGQKILARSILAALASSLILVNGAYAVEFAKGKILVKPAPGLSEAKLEKILKTVNARSRGRLMGLDVHEVDVPARAEEAVARALSRNPNIQFAEPDYLLEPVGTVNDPGYGSQWHLPKMQAPSAWAYGDGNGVTVAILDTGVYANHVDLTGQVLSGWNTVSNSGDTSDIHGHGTWVAGTVAATTNNAVGVASTAPGAKILPVRISDRTDGAAYSSDAAEGIRWAVDQGARVANLSYGFGGNSTVSYAASYMMSMGGVVVVAAGNQSSDPGYAQDPYLFVAAATDSGDRKASYSNYGSFVDIAAPGSAIYTTSRSGGYSSVNGTSFASPNAAAVAALVMAANPGLSATDVLSIMEDSAADLGSAGWDPYFGHGRVDALAAVQLAAGSGATTDTTPPNAEIGSPSNGETVNDLVSISVLASDDYGVESVTLFVNGSELATSTQASSGGVYDFSWDSTTVSDGEHRLTALAIDGAGNTAESADVLVTVDQQDVIQNSPPTASFTVDCMDLDCSFGDSSTDSDGYVSERLWDFGDGNTSTILNPVHYYAFSGVYTVTLLVTDDGGATDSVSKRVSVSFSDNTPPVVTAPDDVTVTAITETTSVDLGIPVVTDDLDPDPVVTNDAPSSFPVGTTTVTWTATDASGNAATDKQLVTVSEAETNAISLSVSGEKIKGDKFANLIWAGMEGSTIYVYRDGELVDSTPNDGTYTHGPFGSGKPAGYKVCEAGGAVCSNEVMVAW